MLKKKKGKRTGFWRSYSVVLTFVLLVSLSVVAASAETILSPFAKGSASSLVRIYNGMLQQKTSSGWANSSMDLVTYMNYALGLDSAKVGGSGGLTQAELDDSLERYVGEPVSEVLFPSLSGKPGIGVRLVVSDLYDAIGKNASYSSGAIITAMKDIFFSVDSFDRYLDADGTVKTAVANSDGYYDKFSVSSLLSNGLRGLNVNMQSGFSEQLSHFDLYRDSFDRFSDSNHDDLAQVHGDLVGSGSSSVTFWNSSDQSVTTEEYKDLLSALTSLGTSVQNDLAKLRYVLASDKDIEMAEKQEPVKDAVGDSFTGDSPAAVKPGDVGDMAGISGGFQGAFSTGANAGDALSVISKTDDWNFFSQEVANDLNRVPAVASDELEDDFIHFYDPSVLDSYLSGGGRS